jgi:hypothetical protein
VIERQADTFLRTWPLCDLNFICGWSGKPSRGCDGNETLPFTRALKKPTPKKKQAARKRGIAHIEVTGSLERDTKMRRSSRQMVSGNKGSDSTGSGGKKNSKNSGSKSSKSSASKRGASGGGEPRPSPKEQRTDDSVTDSDCYGDYGGGDYGGGCVCVCLCACVCVYVCVYVRARASLAGTYAHARAHTYHNARAHTHTHTP